MESNERTDELEYDAAPLYRRWFSTILDLFLMVLFALAVYGLTSYVTNNVPSYVRLVSQRDERMEDSYLYQDGKLLSTVLEDEDLPYSEKKDRLSESLDMFYLDFLKDGELFQSYQREKEQATDSTGSKIFVKDGDVYVEKGDYAPEVYFSFYKSVMEGPAASALSIDPAYNEATKQITLVSVVELFLCFAFGYSFAFLFFPLVLRRGRKTVGMYIFKISLIGGDALNLHGKRLALRLALSFFVYYVLSVFTFGIPVLVSLTMMHLGKRHQSFLDYMTESYVVSTAKQDVYLDFAEYERRKGQKALSIESKDLRLTRKR